MARLYISSDIDEARNIIDEGHSHLSGVISDFHELDLDTRASLEKRVGFSPGTSIEFRPSASQRCIDAIVTRLTRHRLFVALDADDGTTKRYSVPPESGIQEGPMEDRSGPFSTRKL